MQQHKHAWVPIKKAEKLATQAHPILAVAFDSYMRHDDDLSDKDLRLLEVDRSLILPTHESIRLVCTGADVIHAWSVPSFGVKVDCIPGRLNQIPLHVVVAGTSYGQCSELCGINHGFMPIEVVAIS